MGESELHVGELEDKIDNIIYTTKFQDRLYEICSSQELVSIEQGEILVNQLEREFLKQNDDFPSDKITGEALKDLVSAIFQRKVFRMYTQEILSQFEDDVENLDDVRDAFEP